MRHLGFLFLFYSLCSMGICIAQTSITGKVQDESGKPLAAASVFLASTSFGTMADNQGFFSLSGMAAGRYDLVVSCMGYQTISQSIDTRQVTEPLTIVLQAKVEELDNVTIGPGEESTWEKWGKFFLENFIGTMPESQQCFIENSSAIRFRHYAKQKLLRATSQKPLIVTNRALGYTITYQLEYFQYDFDSKIVYYLGYPLFRELDPKNERRKKQWAENRKDAYYGSQLHFLRSIYRNTALQEGFEMRKLVKQPDMTDILFSPILPGDSVAFQVNPNTAGLAFTDYLHITYINEKEHPGYVRAQMRETQKPGFQVSTLKMNEPKTLEIGQQGMVNDPLIVLISGYWGWSDKIATMLPYDYKLPKLKE